MQSIAQRPPVELALSDSPGTEAESAPWIGPLVALGARASRYIDRLGDRQLVVAISVPRRDFAAVLIGCGWVMSSPAKEEVKAISVFRALEARTPVRIVTTRDVIVDYFWRLDESVTPPRVLIGGSRWEIGSIKAVEVLEVLEELVAPRRMLRPAPGMLGRMARVEESWDQRLASPAADLAIVGTQTWLRAEFQALVSRDGDEAPLPDTSDPRTISHIGSLGNVLLPAEAGSATWFTRIHPAAGFAGSLPMKKNVRAVVLDGSGAIKYLAEMETPVVLCVLDRSVADETAAEIIVQQRNSHGEPVSLREELGWYPPAGVEALAFTVAL